jgi:hypothetical protein
MKNNPKKNHEQRRKFKPYRSTVDSRMQTLNPLREEATRLGRQFSE